jgi:hypothetical protein
MLVLMVMAMVKAPKSNQNARRQTSPPDCSKAGGGGSPIPFKPLNKRLGWLATCAVQGVNFPVALFIGAPGNKL